MPNTNCKHLEINADVQIARLTDSKGVLTGFSANITVTCSCGEKFVWIGPCGMSPHKPMISMDGFQLRAPLEPQVGGQYLEDILLAPLPGEA